jgi:PAS domain S-box-containing protein
MAPGFFDRLVTKLDKIDPESLQTHLLRLARERGLLETIFQSIQEGVLVVDGEGRLTYANRAAAGLLGFEIDRMRGRSVVQYLRDLDWDRLLDVRSHDAWSHLLSREIEIARPERRILHFYAVPLPQKDTLGAGVLIILRDVTRDRQQEATLLEGERLQAVTLLAAGVAHEIGNPLNALTIHLQLLERELRGLPEDLRGPLVELVDVARNEVGRLDAILSQFLRALRPSKPQLAPDSVADVLQETLKLAKVEIENRRIGVALEYPESIPPVHIDRQQIKQVFFNLIKNALEAMPDGGQLKITVSVGDAFVCIAFLDTGVGIRPEEMGRLFEPYHTTKADGTGLGLMIVQRIVQEHGGVIEVSSKPKAGTCFRVLLPLADRRVRMLSQPARTPAESRPPTARRSRGGRRRERHAAGAAGDTGTEPTP